MATSENLAFKAHTSTQGMQLWPSDCGLHAWPTAQISCEEERASVPCRAADPPQHVQLYLYAQGAGEILGVGHLCQNQTRRAPETQVLGVNISTAFEIPPCPVTLNVLLIKAWIT